MTKFSNFLGLGVLVLSLGEVTANASPIGLQNATATFSQNLFSVAFAIDGSTSNGEGWAIDPQEANQIAVFQTNVNVGFAGGSNFTFTLTQNFGTQHDLGDFRLSVTTDSLPTAGNVTANWILLTPTSAVAANGTTLSVLGNSSVLASGTSPNTDVYTVKAFTALTGITGIRLEVLTNPSLPFNGPGRHPTNGNFVLSELGLDVTAAVPEPAAWLLFLSGGTLVLLGRRRFAPPSR
jgi:hypothetical protein